MTLVKVNITYFKVKSLESAGKGSDLFSSRLLDIVHYEDFRVPFDRTDLDLHCDTPCDIFGLSFHGNGTLLHRITNIHIKARAKTDQRSLSYIQTVLYRLHALIIFALKKLVTIG